MFSTQYYTLIASLTEYSLDTDAKGFDAREVIDEVLDSISRKDAVLVRQLYGYYDCENIIAIRDARSQHNPLGNYTRDELVEQLEAPTTLPREVVKLLEAYDEPEGEAAEEFDTNERFERNLFEIYYKGCAGSSSRFLRAYSQFDRNLRNVAAAVTARSAGRAVESVTVGDGEIVEQLHRSSAADFGLRGELSYIDAVIAAVNDEPSLLEKERKIDLIRWEQALELSTFDYFDINAILSYLVRLNIVARWSVLDAKRGRELFEKLLSELDAKELIKDKNR